MKIKQCFRANQSCKHKGSIYSSVIHSGNVPRSPTIEDMGKILEQKKNYFEFQKVYSKYMCIYTYINFSSDSLFSVANMYIYILYEYIFSCACKCIYTYICYRCVYTYMYMFIHIYIC